MFLDLEMKILRVKFHSNVAVQWSNMGRNALVAQGKIGCIMLNNMFSSIVLVVTITMKQWLKTRAYIYIYNVAISQTF